MKKAHILKKKEARFWERIGPVTEDNMDTYPIGNPFKKTTKKEIEEMGNFIREHRKNNPISDEKRQEILELQERFRLEDKQNEEKRKRLKIKKIFIK